MSMTNEEIKEKAMAAQAKWGDYGCKEGDSQELVNYKIALQIETVMIQFGKIGEAVDGQRQLLDMFAKGLDEMSEKIENKPRIITDLSGH